MSKWTKDQTDTFIGLFKEQPLLYNCSDPWYKKRECRKHALESLRAAICKSRPHTTVNEVKMKIRTLRTQYCAEKIAAAKFERNPYYKYVPKLWCYEKLKFLEFSDKDDCKMDVIDVQSVEDESNEGTLEPQYVQLSELTNPEQQFPDEEQRSQEHQQLFEFEVRQEDIADSVENDPLSPMRKKERRTKLTKKRKISHKRLQYKADTALLNYLKTATQQQTATVVENETAEINEKVFGDFIAAELQRIRNSEIREDIKWEIQLALRKGIQRAIKKNFHGLKTAAAKTLSAQNQSAESSEILKQQNIFCRIEK